MAQHRPTRMTDAEIIAACEAKFRDANALYGSRLARERQQAEDYYLGKPLGTEEEGQSQVVIRDVAEAIDSVMPELMEVFAGSERIAVFSPNHPADVAAAQQATDYCAWAWETQRPVGGFMLLYNWFKDALLHKVGVIKVWWDDTPDYAPEDYEGLTQEQVIALSVDGELEIEAVELEPPAGPQTPPTYAVRARRMRSAGRVRIANVPQDEFVIDRNAVSVDEVPFIGQRSKKTVSELVAEGFDYDTVCQLGRGDDDAEFAPERQTRFEVEGHGGVMPREEPDEPSREVWVNEFYIRADFDGDGHAELRQVIYSGSTLLSNVEVDSHPYCDLCPIPMPHRFYGLSLADLTMDIQLVKSTLVRQMLMNLYLTNNPEKEVLEGAVNIDDLLVSRPGGIKRVRQPNAIREIETRFVAGQSFPMLEYLDQQRETRTGALRYNQGLDADALNKTASGMMRMMDAGQRRIRLIARIFAETGVKRAFRRIFELTIKHQRIKQIVRLRDTFVQIDPSNWRDEWDVTVMVGLGTGNRELLFQQLLALIQLDMGIAQTQGGLHGPLVRARNLGHKLVKLVETTGLRLPELYYTVPGPEAEQPPQPAPPPELLKAQAQIAADQQKLQAEMQMEAAEAQHKLALDRERMLAEIAMKRERNALELQLMRERHAQEMALRRQEAEARLTMQAVETRAKADAVRAAAQEEPA